MEKAWGTRSFFVKAAPSLLSPWKLLLLAFADSRCWTVGQALKAGKHAVEHAVVAAYSLTCTLHAGYFSGEDDNRDCPEFVSCNVSVVINAGLATFSYQ